MKKFLKILGKISPVLVAVFALVLIMQSPNFANGNNGNGGGGGQPLYTSPHTWDRRGADNTDECIEKDGEDGRDASEGWIHWVYSTKGDATSAELNLGGSGSGTYYPVGSPAEVWHFFTSFYDLKALTATLTWAGDAGPGGGLVISDYCPGEQENGGLTPVCGGFATNFGYDDIDWPAEGEFCEVGDPDPKNPEFPEMGETTPWYCVIEINSVANTLMVNNDNVEENKVLCEATRDEEPPVLACGGFADHYAYGISEWPAVGDFCDEGTVVPTNPEFPAQGEKTIWYCTNDVEPVECEATRGTEPEVEGVKDEPKKEEPKPAVLAASTVAITETSGGNTSSVIAMQVILLISLVSAVWSYFEGESFLTILGKRK